jgi:integrase
MPRLSNSLPKYRKHRASGQAVVTLNGRDIYLGSYNTKASKTEYDRLVGEWLAANRSPAYGASVGQISVGELLAVYLKYAKKYYGGGSRGEYAKMLFAVKPLKELYSRQPVREFGPLQLKAVRDLFIARGNARSYINANVQKIVRVFRWGVAEGLVAPDVALALGMVPGLRRGRTVAPEGKKIRPVEDALVEATLPKLSPTLKAMVRLQQLTGMRPGELVILRPCDIDRSGDMWEYRPAEHKNAHRDQERTVYLGPQAQDVLRPYLLRPADAYCFSPREVERQRRAQLSANRKTPLSCGNRPGTNRRRNAKRPPGDRYTTASYHYAIRRACDKAFPVPEDLNDDKSAIAEWRKSHRWTPHQLRHGLATKVRRDFDIESAKVLLGHSQINTTGIYAEQDRRKAIEVTRLIG